MLKTTLFLHNLSLVLYTVAAVYSTAALFVHRLPLFVGRLTGDQRVMDKAVELLMAPCGFDRWLGKGFEDSRWFSPAWHAALETGMMTRAMATGYDLLHEYLTDDQRKQVRAALMDKGVRPLVRDWADPVGFSQIPRHQLPTGNWVMVCSASAGMGLLAVLEEEPDAPELLRLVRNRVRAWLRDRGGDWFVDNPWPNGRPDPIPVIGPSEPNFGPDGGYKESISYMLKEA